MIIRSDHVLFEPLVESGVRHCFTTRSFFEEAGGHDRSALAGRLAARFFPDASSVVWGEQVHGAEVAPYAAGGPALLEIPGADALVCTEPGVCLVCFAADCPIIYIVDGGKGALGLVHAGRRGVEAGIVRAAFRAMAELFGSSPSDCLAVVSPSIGPCCYPVDLWATIGREFERLGVGKAVNPRICTSCRGDLFFSYRREKGECGRMLAALCARP